VTAPPNAHDLTTALAAADDAIRPLLAAVDIDDLARHNAGYSGYRNAPFERFVADERARFERAAAVIADTKPSGSRVIDLGCFIPHLPVALARLGYRVTLVERFDLYGPSFRVELERLAIREDLEIVDLDLSSESLTSLGRGDLVLLMAVLEHLNGSPADLLRRIRPLLGTDGVLLVEVPNIAELGKRLSLMRGQSPLPAYAEYLESAYPFTGHNREMTVAEVLEMLKGTGYGVGHVETYDYVPSHRLSFRGRLQRSAKRLLPMSFRELILATAHPNGEI
jgi:SAM-dependent methyltransferase